MLHLISQSSTSDRSRIGLSAEIGYPIVGSWLHMREGHMQNDAIYREDWAGTDQGIQFDDAEEISLSYPESKPRAIRSSMGKRPPPWIPGKPTTRYTNNPGLQLWTVQDYRTMIKTLDVREPVPDSDTSQSNESNDLGRGLSTAPSEPRLRGASQRVRNLPGTTNHANVWEDKKLLLCGRPS